MTTNKPNEKTSASQPSKPTSGAPLPLQQAGKPPQAKNEGEGNRTADREYRDGAKAFVRSGQVDARAKEAAAAVDGPEGPALRKAEEKARNAGKR